MDTLIVTRPIRSSRISQRFGENRACLTYNNRIVGASGACPSGTRPYYQAIGMKGHNGIDLPAITGEAVYHCGKYDGWMKTEKDAAGGIGVDVVSNERLFFPGTPPPTLLGVEMDYRDGVMGFLSYVKIRQWHLSGIVGHDGKQVKYGTQIGLAGSTGASSAPHVHLGAKFCDKDGNALDDGNGYNGAFDFTPHYRHDTFAGAPPQPLTEAERKEATSQLSYLARTLLAMRELLSKK